jgi:hypothetical protein
MGRLISLEYSRSVHDIPQPIFAVFGRNLARAPAPEPAPARAARAKRPRAPAGKRRRR